MASFVYCSLIIGLLGMVAVLLVGVKVLGLPSMAIIMVTWCVLTAYMYWPRKIK